MCPDKSVKLSAFSVFTVQSTQATCAVTLTIGPCSIWARQPRFDFDCADKHANAKGCMRDYQLPPLRAEVRIR